MDLGRNSLATIPEGLMFSSILGIIMPSEVLNISIGREWKGVWFNTSHRIHGFHIVSEDPLTQVCWYIPYWNCRHDLLGVEQPETARVQREPQQKLFGSNTPVKPWLWIPSTCNLRLFICFRSTGVCSCSTTSVEGLPDKIDARKADLWCISLQGWYWNREQLKLQQPLAVWLRNLFDYYQKDSQSDSLSGCLRPIKATELLIFAQYAADVLAL